MTPSAGAERLVIVGSGSVVPRHVQAVRSICPNARFALLRRQSTANSPPALQAEVSEVFDSIDDALVWEPDGALIANAATAHVESATPFVEAGIPTFVEKPLAAYPGESESLVELGRASGTPLLVGYCQRYHPPIVRLHELVVSGGVGRPLLVHASAGQRLEEWRPGRDYRHSVTAQKRLGGGALLELSHEIDLALWVLGGASEVSAAVQRVSDLDIDTDDVADLLLGFPSGARANLHLDLLWRGGQREFSVVGDEAVLSWCQADDRVHIRSREGDSTDVSPAGEEWDSETRFRQQMRHWLDVVHGEATPRVTSEDAHAVIVVCSAARLSASSGERVILDQR